MDGERFCCNEPSRTGCFEGVVVGVGGKRSQVEAARLLKCGGIPCDESPVPPRPWRMKLESANRTFLIARDSFNEQDGARSTRLLRARLMGVLNSRFYRIKVTDTNSGA